MTLRVEAKIPGEGRKTIGGVGTGGFGAFLITAEQVKHGARSLVTNHGKEQVDKTATAVVLVKDDTDKTPPSIKATVITGAQSTAGYSQRDLNSYPSYTLPTVTKESTVNLGEFYPIGSIYVVAK